MLTVRFVVDLKARGARCCAVARGQACCPTVLALLLPRRWPALRACSLADKDAYIFVYYGISPNLVGGKGGEPLGLGLTPHAGKLSYSIKLKFTPSSLVGCGVKLPPPTAAPLASGVHEGGLKPPTPPVPEPLVPASYEPDPA